MIVQPALVSIFATVIAFEVALVFYRKTGISLLNPVLVSVVILLLGMTYFNIDYSLYEKGGAIITFFLGPATVILAIPLYQARSYLKKHYLLILVSITLGSIVNFFTIYMLSRWLGLHETIIHSLLPKSVTMPIGVEISSSLGGIESFTVCAIVITGISGAALGPLLLRILKVRNSVAKGIALGTASHAIGTSKAIEMGKVEGAMSGLAIGVTGLITVVLIPILLKFL